jgi:hypothetical protein
MPRHAAVPAVVEYVPETHGVHVSVIADEEPSGPALPAAQGVPAQAVAPTDGA